MKTTIKKIRFIEFTQDELKIFNELGLGHFRNAFNNYALLDDYASNELKTLLIDKNPEQDKHRNFIMKLLKELKK